MKVAMPLLTLLLACAAQPALAPALSAQQAVSAPASGKSIGPGFAHKWEAGLVRTQAGWVGRDYPRVTSLVEGSTAARAGVRTGDVIVSVNGRDGRQSPLFRDLRPGSNIVMRVRRGDEEREIRFQVAA